VVILTTLGFALHGGAARAATVTVTTSFSAGPPASAAWNPSTISASVGDTVTFTNAGGGAPHDLQWSDGAPGIARAPAPFAPNIAAWTSSRTMTAAGDFSFVCSFHAMIGMTGVVHVAAAPAPAPAPGPAEPAPTPAAGVDRTAPSLAATATGTRRAVTLKLRLGEPARVTVIVIRGRRTLARKRFAKTITGRATLRVPVRTRPGVVRVRVTAVDAAGNVTRRTLRVRLR
jgi:plastocyanin